MPFSNYTNEQDILNSRNLVRGVRLNTKDLEFLDLRPYSVQASYPAPPITEMHVYTSDGVYINGLHNINQYSKVEFNDNNSGDVVEQYLSVDTNSALEELNLTRGQYKIVYNTLYNVIGSYEGQKLWVYEISPSRREVRIRLTDNESNTLRSELLNFYNYYIARSKPSDLFNTYTLNFGFNNIVPIVNIRFDRRNSANPEIVLRLYSPLPADIEEKDKCWISFEVSNPAVTSVTITPQIPERTFNRLSGPNFDLEELESTSIATDFKSWNDLLGSNITTSQQLVDSYFSGSLSGIKLNINYRLFDNYVHYSSAVERVKNFHYKLQLIEYYSDQIQTLSQVNGGNITNVNIQDVFSKRNSVVSSFDDFEKYLFFESTGSKLYTHYDITGSIDPWPKTQPTSLQWQQAYMLWSQFSQTWQVSSGPDPYGYFSTQVRTTSTQGQTYYQNLLSLAKTYDDNNVHKLENAIPLHLRNLEDADQFLLFVHMLGHHFDILWTYINSLTLIHSREEHPKDGMSDDLLYHVAESLGFKLIDGRSVSDLWKYTIGVDENGEVIQQNVDGRTSLSDRNSTREVWRRIVNNLPYILKNKGTSRSIKALLSCFGIPSTVLTIKEYGGPSTFTDNDHFPEYVHDVYHYAWLSDTGSLELPVTTYVNSLGNTISANTLQFRFKPDENFSYTPNSYYNIFSAPSASVNDVYHLILNTSNVLNEGTLTLFNSVTGNAVSASNVYIFDNSWHNVYVESTNSTGSLKVARTKYGKTTYIKSSSFSGDLNVFPTTGTETFTFASGSRTLSSPVTLPNGTTVSNLSKFNGHYHEIRIWSGTLNDATIREHGASPNTYTYNIDRISLSTGEQASKPYDHLLQRFTLANKQIESGSFYQNSVHPNQRINTGSLYFIGFTNSGSINFEGFEEQYTTPSPSLGGNSLYTNKIRIDSSSFIPGRTLNTKTRATRSSLDRYSLDSNRLGVYFSPQTAINEDIFNQLGYFEIDDYIGDPNDEYSEKYPRLINFSTNYWKKYDNRNDFEAYFRALEIYDFSLFKYIKQLLPNRANPIVGLLVEPNVLERSKVRIMRNKPGIEDLTYDMSLEREPELTGEYSSIPMTIDWPLEIESNVNDDISFGIDISRNSEIEFSSEVLSNFEVGQIDNLTNQNKLPNQWIQNRYIGVYKIQESASYVAYDPNSIVLNSRPSTYLVDKEERYKILAWSGSSSTASGGEIARFSLPYPGTYYVSASFDDLNGDVRVQDTLTILDTIPQISAFNRTGSYDNEFRFNTNLIIFRNVGLNTVVTKQILIYQLNYSQTQDFIPRGTLNHRYLGSKLTASAVNVDTSVTIDGGPVVKVTEVNPNKLVFSSNQLTTVSKTISGKQTKSN